MERDEADGFEGGGKAFSRRGLLTGAMLGAAALLVAGCEFESDDDDDDDDEDDGGRRRRRRRR